MSIISKDHNQVEFLQVSSLETPESVLDYEGTAREVGPVLATLSIIVPLILAMTIIAMFIYSRVDIKGNWVFFLLYLLVILGSIPFYLGDRKKVGEMKNISVGLGNVGIITNLGTPKKEYHLIPGDYKFANLWYWYGRWQHKLLEVINISYPFDLLFEDVIIAGGMRVNIKLSLLVKVINHFLFLTVETGLKGNKSGGIEERLKDSLGSIVFQAAGQVSRLEHFRVPVGKESPLDKNKVYEQSLPKASSFTYQNLTRFENLLWDQLSKEDEYHLFEAGKDNPDISALELGLIIRSFFIKEAVDKTGKVTEANEAVIVQGMRQKEMEIESKILQDMVIAMIDLYPEDQRRGADRETAIQRAMIVLNHYTQERAVDIVGLSKATEGVASIFKTLGPVIVSALQEAGFEKK